ncbi:hypothetical protein LCGC14_0550150 [marine sediment metagenome]|uniref:Uncharacterized protein n=1 Tax=marine sediment metagenome TaxID=412755 RepID=A0A0F9UYG0_9ZZZZ
MTTELEKLQESEVELAKLDEQIQVLRNKQKFAINRAGTQNRYLTSIN